MWQQDLNINKNYQHLVVIPSQVFTMKVLLLLLLALSDILAEDKNVSPLYNCFVENFTPSKETTNDCFSCILEVTELKREVYVFINMLLRVW